MTIKGKGGLWALGALGLVLAGAGPAFAQHSSGGGHGGGGGGSHSSGGGGARGGGGHPSGGGAHFAAPAHYAGGGARSYGGGGGGRYYAAGTGHYGGGYGGASHTAYAGRVGYGGHGYSTGRWRGESGRGGGWHDGWRGGGWYGGYWRGGFWPRCYYGAGFDWFLPILPLAYATYWYGGIPYYYANDVYYTYNPSEEGYVVTDPPPVADMNRSADGGAVSPNDARAPDQIFMYPKNGQSAEQQAVDKAECQRWASDQAGQVAQNGSDYSRAMTACVEGRGYSAR